MAYGYVSVPGVGGTSYQTAADYEQAQADAYALYAQDDAASAASLGTLPGGVLPSGLGSAIGSAVGAVGQALGLTNGAQPYEGEGEGQTGASATPYGIYLVIAGFILLVIVASKGK